MLAISEKMIRKLRARHDAAARRAASRRRHAARPRRDDGRTSSTRASQPESGHAHRSSASTAPSTSASFATCSASRSNAGDYLPLDTKSANFDNIADVQALSPTLLEAYLNAAAAVSRMAIGDRNAPADARHATTHRRSCRSIRGITSRARRTERAAASSRRTTSPPTGCTRSD